MAPNIVPGSEQIPEFLRTLPRWLTWKLTTNPQGKPTKKPDQSTTNGKAARTFQAVANVPRNADGGIGFITTGKIPVPLTDGRRARMLLVDADACRDPHTGALSPWAATMLELLAHPYTEVSPSGTGLRAIVAVLDLPEHLKATVMLTGEQPPPGVNKKPQIQLFGLGPAGYVALTGQRLAICASGLTVEENVEAFVRRFNLIGEAPSKTGVTGVEQVVGLGNVPTESEIAARVAEMPNGRELLAADWQKVMPEKSASEAFYRFVTMVLTATNGHGEAALDFVMGSMWGTGQVDDSRDPSKYGCRSWVAKEIVRVANKQGTPKTNTDVFDLLPDQPKQDSPEAFLAEALEGITPEPLTPSSTWQRPVGDALVDFAARFAAVQATEDDGVLVPGLLGRGRITNVAAGPKTGKSTLLECALVGYSLPVPSTFPGFGAPAKQLRVLYLSENNPDDDAVMIAAFSAGDIALKGLDRRAIPPAAMASWPAFLQWVARIVKDGSFDVVVLDSFEAWVPDLEDGNSGAQVAQRYGELSRIVAQACNVAVLCVLHTKKDAGPTLNFDDMLGSTKFRASSDFNVMLARVSPDEPRDTRIVLRREGRDPFALIRTVCGRLPDSIPAAIRDRSPAGPARLCYRLVGEIVRGNDGRERAAMRYELVDVPAEWAGATSRPATIQKADGRRLDEDVLMAAVHLHTAERGPKPVSSRKLVKDGWVERAAARMPTLPAGYLPPGDKRVRSAEARLIEDRKLEPHDGGGVTVAPPGAAFEPLTEGVR